MDTLDEMMMTRSPTARRPLLGLTVLVVEDSRFACEALRLLCLRSGARIRRADSLEHADRHLAIYRPSVVLVDVGLPDGSGLSLIKSLADASPRIDVILGISGDPATQAAVMASGADGFMAKPIASIAAFQSAILEHLPDDRQPPSPRELSDEMISPDPIAYQDDLSHIAQVLKAADDNTNIDYITQFLGGVAQSANDHDLHRAVRDLVSSRTSNGTLEQEVQALSKMIETRIAAGGVI